ncbi:PAS domain S-box-containing protein [Mucilaginibacter auburnensis]|uniref:histidine kinase n=2 Tax=Mucilaginibacter auburnensis TaxID=1457233 RepID=A0A2H9VTI2_9SPHI|nr:PAS domain S-box-containing protein [Mucilaginibacter auburnensis]
MIDDAPVAIAVLTGRSMTIEAANQYMLRIWGKPATVVGLNLIDALPELREQVFMSLLENVFDTGESFTGNEARVFLEYEGNLAERFVNFVYKAMVNESGDVYSIMVVANDVTEQVLARKSVEAARHRLEAMVTTTPIAMTILKGRDLIIEQANAAMYQIWQRNSTQTMGKKLIDVFPELIGQPFPDLLANVFETGEKVAFPEMPVNIAFPDGSSKDIFVNFSYDPLFDLDGKVEAILASVSDITEQVEARLKLEKSEQDLQIATEELAAANEELTAINEEMMASNEELASTNEELISTQDHLHNTIEQLNESKERFSFLLNSIPQQIWTAKPDGALDYVNDVVCDDFGYDKDEVVGHGWQKFIHPDDLPKALDKWMHALENGNEYLIEFRLLFADGIYRWHLGRALPLIENGEIQLWLGSNTNIDLQKTNEQKKDEFLSIASHELKTPLTSIKAFNQMLKRGAMPDTLKGFVQKSADNIQRLEKLIADLLDVTKMNSGKLEYDMQPFSFNKLLVESAENTRYLSSSHEVVLKNAADVQILGDNVRLEQVLNNFLSNAVKYSPKGKQIIIDSWIEGQQVIVSVQDFGIGIAPSHIDKLFDRYYRVDNTAMRFEGLGLGLFISSEILKRHGGKVWIESEQDKGSTFYFSLPLAPEQVEHRVKGIPVNVPSAETDLA